MAFVIADRVRETTTTTGTGAVTLAGAYVSFQTFLAAIGNGNNTYYTIASAATGEWEVGIGTYSSGPNSLSRDTILASSSGGAAVNFSAGPKDVFVTQPSERSLLLNAASNGLFAGNPAFTANGIPYANSTTTLTTGSALTFDGTNLGVGGTATALGTYRGAEFAGTTATTGGFLRMRTSDSSVNSLDFTDANGRGIFTTTNHPLRFGVNDSEQMRLTSTGLGIGTSSPGTKLEVVGVITTTSGSAKGYLYSDGTNINLETNGAYPIRFRGGASTATWATLDASGNLGLGVTPSAWSGFRALQVGGATSIWSSASGAGSSFYSNNVYFDGSNRRRINAGFATEYIQDSSAGAHLWFTAASSTAGSTISFTQAMTLDASGLLAIGRTSAWDSNALLTLEKSGVAAQVINCTTNAVTLINVANGGASIAYTGTASNHPFAFYTNGSERARIDSSGNLGLGVTPSAWGANGKPLQTGNASFWGLVGTATFSSVGANYFYDGSYKYISNGVASDYYQLSGAHVWRTAGSGTAGAAISFTQAMTLDASGNLGIGTSSPAARLDLNASGTNAQLAVQNWPMLRATNTTLDIGGYNASQWTQTRLYTNGNIAATLDASGNLGLGATPSAWDGYKTLQLPAGSFASFSTNFLEVDQNAFWSASGYRYVNNGFASQYRQTNGAHSWFTAPSGTAGNAISWTQAMTLDASGRLGIGNTSPQTTLGLASQSTISWGTTNYPFISGDQPNNTLTFGTQATERARITSSGDLLVGTTTSSGKLTVADNAAAGAGATNTFVALQTLEDSGTVAALTLRSLFTNSNQTNKLVASINLGVVTNGTASPSADIRFNTINAGTFAERARIDSSGNLLVGTTSVYGRFTVGNNAGGSNSIAAVQTVAGGYNFYSDTVDNGGVYYHAQFRAAATAVGAITSSTTTTTYATSSDYRLKEDVQPMTGALAKVAALKPCTYKWKADGSAGEGFIAHELAEVCPAAVAGEKDAVNEDGSIKPQGIDTSFLVATLAAAIQELKAEFDAYKATHP